MADAIVLEAKKRDVFGKEVRHLRREGVIPGVLYGPEFEAIPVQMEWPVLRPVLRAAGGSAIIELNIEGQSYNALVRDVQRTPIHGDVMHIDFYRVRMDVAIRTDVPIVTVGEATVIEELGGIVSQEMNAISIECLPLDLPSQIEIDISVLEEVGNSLLVSDLPEFKGVTYLVAADETVITTSYPAVLASEEEDEEDLEGEIEAGAEPELIRPDRGEDEDEE